MRMNKIYAIIIDEIIAETSTRISDIQKAFEKIRKIYPNAYITTYYC